MSSPQSSFPTTSEPLSPVFDPAYHAVVAPDIGTVYCLTDATLLGLLQQIRERVETIMQLFVFGPDGARYPVLASSTGHLVTPEGIFSLGGMVEISEEVDEGGFLPRAISFTSGAKAKVQEGPQVSSDGGEDLDDDFPLL